MELIFDKIYHVLNIITTNFCDDYKLRKKKESDRWLDNIYYVYWKKNIVLAILVLALVPIGNVYLYVSASTVILQIIRIMRF